MKDILERLSSAVNCISRISVIIIESIENDSLLDNANRVNLYINNTVFSSYIEVYNKKNKIYKNKILKKLKELLPDENFVSSEISSEIDSPNMVVFINTAYLLTDCIKIFPPNLSYFVNGHTREIEASIKYYAVKGGYTGRRIIIKKKNLVNKEFNLLRMLCLTNGDVDLNNPAERLKPTDTELLMAELEPDFGKEYLELIWSWSDVKKK